MEPILNVYSMSERPKWAEEAEQNVLLLFSGGEKSANGAAESVRRLGGRSAKQG
ncbi:accessory colonization factor AcfC [Caldalkalibacillus uzonensis]|uniref:Accessory colonization factor AcfC n=1 Tax=Caldalkalibacillus uzonensis TaxID=353224 RepID=A0ABU0CP10_9BACI|nr:hypothetical protein [Caldalkalibacillus uzonensis]MDQ0338153.1 accessory colonization factor AcfC [Caldalkalibacillus uzonensis]